MPKHVWRPRGTKRQSTHARTHARTHTHTHTHTHTTALGPTAAPGSAQLHQGRRDWHPCQSAPHALTPNSGLPIPPHSADGIVVGCSTSQRLPPSPRPHRLSQLTHSADHLIQRTFTSCLIPSMSLITTAAISRASCTIFKKVFQSTPPGIIQSTSGPPTNTLPASGVLAVGDQANLLVESTADDVIASS